MDNVLGLKMFKNHGTVTTVLNVKWTSHEKAKFVFY